MIVDLRLASGAPKARYAAQPLPIVVAGGVAVRAVWTRPSVTTDYVVIAQDDVLHEYFYSDRYYNIFVLYDGNTATLKGWYCNICRPAVITPDLIWCEDLALDLWVAADGAQRVLDEDEFAALGLPPDEANRCHAALAELQQLARAGQLPQ